MLGGQEDRCLPVIPTGEERGQWINLSSKVCMYCSHGKRPGRGDVDDDIDAFMFYQWPLILLLLQSFACLAIFLPGLLLMSMIISFVL